MVLSPLPVINFLYGKLRSRAGRLDCIREIKRSITPSFANDRAERGGRELSLELLRSLLKTVGVYKDCLH